MVRRRARTLTILVPLLWLAVVAIPSTVVSAAPSCLEPGKTWPAVPWAQQTLHFERTWPMATGAGITVAVLDSGVDSRHPQLIGHVAAGADFLHRGGKPPGDTDCVGHGTAVASVIVAQEQGDSGLRGVAPAARILPVTVSEKSAAAQGEPGDAASPAQLAAALRWAVDQGARVVNLSVVYYADYPEIRQATEYAVKRDVVVVAAVGNLGSDSDKNPTPYPAAYPDVIGVGAIDKKGTVPPYSAHGSFVDIVAPGAEIVAATPQRGHGQFDGTSLAAPFVTGAAALVRQYWPDLTAAKVRERLLATADPVTGSADPAYVGRGLVDPYRAVTEYRGGVPSLAVPPRVAPQVDAAALAAAERDRRLADLAGALAAIAMAFAVAVVGFAVVRRRGRRTRWRPTRAAALPVRPDDVNLAPVGLFEQDPP